MGPRMRSQRRCKEIFPQKKKGDREGKKTRRELRGAKARAERRKGEWRKGESTFILNLFTQQRKNVHQSWPLAS